MRKQGKRLEYKRWGRSEERVLARIGALVRMRPFEISRRFWRKISTLKCYKIIYFSRVFCCLCLLCLAQSSEPFPPGFHPPAAFAGSRTASLLQPHTCLFIANYPRLTALNPHPNGAQRFPTAFSSAAFRTNACFSADVCSSRSPSG